MLAVARTPPAAMMARAPSRGTNCAAKAAATTIPAENGRYATPLRSAEYPRDCCRKNVMKRNIPSSAALISTEIRNDAPRLRSSTTRSGSSGWAVRASQAVKPTRTTTAPTSQATVAPALQPSVAALVKP